jgi:hypothetical protein
MEATMEPSKVAASLRWRDYMQLWSADEVAEGRKIIGTSFPHHVTAALAMQSAAGRTLSGSVLLDVAADLTSTILRQLRAPKEELEAGMRDLQAYSSAHVMWVMGGMRTIRLSDTVMPFLEQMQHAPSAPQYPLDSPELRWYDVNRDANGVDRAASLCILMPEECSIAWIVIQAVKFRDGHRHIDMVTAAMAGIFMERLYYGTPNDERLEAKWADCHPITRAGHTLIAMITSKPEDDVFLSAGTTTKLPIPPGARGRRRALLSGIAYTERVLHMTSAGLRRICRPRQPGQAQASAGVDRGPMAMHMVRDHQRLAVVLRSTALEKGYPIVEPLDDRSVRAFVPIRSHRRGSGALRAVTVVKGDK